MEAFEGRMTGSSGEEVTTGKTGLMLEASPPCDEPTLLPTLDRLTAPPPAGSDVASGAPGR